MFVIDSLKAGLPPDTPTERLGCGAFNREGGDFSLRYGGGFNFTTESHLIERFGFPNICTNWDYSPAREITAIFFPLFEFSMMVYLSLDYISTRLSYNRGEVPRWYMIWNNGKYPITMILCAMFRLIFVFVAYEDPKGHTAGFLCLQLGLVLIAVDNTIFVILTEQSYPKLYLPDRRKVAYTAYVYLALNLVASSFKIKGTWYIVMHGVGSPFYLTDGPFGLKMGQVVDVVWMPLNAVIPLFIAWGRAICEKPIKIQFTSPPPNYSSSNESIALVPLKP
eukprot:CAMPEP_0172382334 /NCGR_PEP_ID=MMETSP1061-20121228/296_1 /TAXON_ID=37318 /ORGANISM="Pseudo-nitzschia pungens, Strain cf. pungens" /LENGTH=278 /DNA_ID=CAMNT_0013110177 /DNA_START=387 /DNA_END=1223 /DNA_ORIENTATION=-